MVHSLIVTRECNADCSAKFLGVAPTLVPLALMYVIEARSAAA
jgi:hypothetical protein